MAAVKELLRAENDGTLSFGDYTLAAKTKKDNFEFEGDIYKVKTFAEITKMEKNGMFVYESVPGSRDKIRNPRIAQALRRRFDPLNTTAGGPFFISLSAFFKPCSDSLIHAHAGADLL